MPASPSTLSFNQQVDAGVSLERQRKRDLKKPKKNSQAKLNFVKNKLWNDDDLSSSDWQKYTRIYKGLERAVDLSRDAMGLKRLVASPGNRLMSQLMMSCWLSLPTLLIAPFAIIWMDIHVLLRKVSPNIFCKLGEEWLNRLGKYGKMAARYALRNTGKMGNTVSDGAMYIEGSLLVALNLILLFVIIIFVCLASLVLGIIA